MTEIIIALCVITVLFVVTWIVIGCNAPDCYPPIPTLDHWSRRDNFRETMEYSQMRNDINELKFYKSCNAFEIPLKKIDTKKLIKELEERGVIGEGKVIKN